MTRNQRERRTYRIPRRVPFNHRRECQGKGREIGLENTRFAFVDSTLTTEKIARMGMGLGGDGRERDYFLKTCIMASFCAWLTSDRVSCTRGRSSEALEWSISVRRKAVWRRRISAFFRRLLSSERAR